MNRQWLRECRIQANYSPIFDAEYKTYKVVEYSTGVTNQVMLTAAMQLSVAQTQEIVRFATEGDLTQRLDTHDKGGDLQQEVAR